MSSNDEVDIGFDPLAWMDDDQGNEPATPKPSAEVSAAEEPSARIVADEKVAVEQPVQVKATETNGVRIELAGRVDIACASELKQELSEALIQSGPITLAAADVARADGAGLQLLTAFVRELDSTNRELSWEAPSEQLIGAAHIVGLKEALHLP